MTEINLNVAVAYTVEIAGVIAVESLFAGVFGVLPAFASAYYSFAEVYLVIALETAAYIIDDEGCNRVCSK